VARTADRLQSPSKLREHTPAENVVIADGFIGSTFTTTWEGKTLSYDLSQPSLDKLEATRRRIWILSGEGTWPEPRARLGDHRACVCGGLFMSVLLEDTSERLLYNQR
jgi:hypothetical protein